MPTHQTTEPLAPPVTNGHARQAPAVMPLDELERVAAGLDGRLGVIEARIREMGKQAKSAQAAWGIFAVLALLIAGANLVAVAVKLDGKKSTAAATPAAASAGNAAAASTPAPAAVHTVGVSLKEFSVNPTSSHASAGKVTFNVRNSGSVTHEFVVVRTNKTAAQLVPPGKARADESGNVGETGDVKAGASKTLRLKLTPGHYVLLCNLPGHYLAGQHADFTVK